MHTYRNRKRETKEKAYRKIQTDVNESCLVPNTGNEPNTVHRRTFPNGGRQGPQRDIWMGLERWLPGCQNEGKKVLPRWSLCLNTPRVSSVSDGTAVQRPPFSASIVLSPTCSYQLSGSESHTAALISILA